MKGEKPSTGDEVVRSRTVRRRKLSGDAAAERRKGCWTDGLERLARALAEA